MLGNWKPKSSWHCLTIATLLVLNSFIKKRSRTKSIDLRSDLFVGHASNPYNNTGIDLLWMSCKVDWKSRHHVIRERARDTTYVRRNTVDYVSAVKCSSELKRFFPCTRAWKVIGWRPSTDAANIYRRMYNLHRCPLGYCRPNPRSGSDWHCWGGCWTIVTRHLT